MRTLMVVSAMVALVGCDEVNVHIHCKTTAVPSIACDLTPTKGKKDVEVCWDVAVTCNNGTVISAPRSCTHVKGVATDYVIGPDKLTNADKCDGGPKLKMSNATVDGKPFAID